MNKSNDNVRTRARKQKCSLLRRCLKIANDGADVTRAGTSFHAAASEAGNVRLPIVERRTSGRCSRSEQDERSRRLDGLSETRVKQD